jgi:sec-independent protein translocase protein TatA
MGGGLLQPGHLLLIVVIVLIVFGPGKLPELGSALGKGLRELKHGLNPNDEPTATTSAPPTALPTAPSATEPASAATCRHCAAPVPATARFCVRCGQPLQAA